MGDVVATGPSTSTVPVMLSIDVGRVALVVECKQKMRKKQVSL